MPNGIRLFDGAVAIITGAASGIGLAISTELARRGAIVAMADIDDAEPAAAKIRASGGRATAYIFDVTDAAAVQHVVEQVHKQHGRLDYIFNNAGIGVAGDIEDHTLAAWQKIIAVNINGVVNGIQAAYPLMIRQGFGHIVNTASMAGFLATGGLSSYVMTKHAVVGLSTSLRLEARHHGVRVSAFCPGVIRTPILSGGRHGVFVGPTPEASYRQRASDMFMRMLPMEPDAFARKALNQVARNDAIIIQPAFLRVVWWLQRFSPSLWLFFANRLYDFSRKKLRAA